MTASSELEDSPGSGPVEVEEDFVAGDLELRPASPQPHSPPGDRVIIMTHFYTPLQTQNDKLFSSLLHPTIDEKLNFFNYSSNVLCRFNFENLIVVLF